MKKKDMENQEIKLRFSDNDLARQLFGEQNNHLDRIAGALGVKIHVRGTAVTVQGDPIAVDLARKVLEQLYGLIKEK